MSQLALSLFWVCPGRYWLAHLCICADPGARCFRTTSAGTARVWFGWHLVHQQTCLSFSLWGSENRVNKASWNVGSGLASHLLATKISQMDSPESREKKKHLEMGGDVISHCKGHEYKGKGRWWAIFIGLSFSLCLDEETEGQGGSETCPGSDSSYKGTELSFA